MSKYRILEKKGTYKYTKNSHPVDTKEKSDNSFYTPRFIVQARITNTFQYEDLKEFTSLEAARVYKLELELIEGIVRE